MFEALKDITCFVTASVCFIYGARITWVCGKTCQFDVSPDGRTQLINRGIPVASFIFTIGYLILFSYLIDSFVARIIAAVLGGIITSIFVVSAAMPELRRKPANVLLIPVEMNDGTMSRINKKQLNDSLTHGKVVRFKRSSGWVVVGRDPLRSPNGKSLYSGIERREAV